MAAAYYASTGSETFPYDTWAKAINSEATLATHIASMSAGDVIYSKSNLTLTANRNFTAVDGSSSTGRLYFIGCKSATTAEPPTDSDYGVPGDRPVVAAGAYQWWFGDYWSIIGMEHTSSYALGMRLEANGYVEGCKGTAGGNSMSVFDMAGANPVLLNSEATQSASETSVIGFDMAGNYARTLYSYSHGVATGVYGGFVHIIKRSVIADCTTGIDVQSGNTVIEDNTLHSESKTSSPVGIQLNANLHAVIIGNAITGLTTGIDASAVDYGRVLDYNNYYNNTSDVSTNVTKESSATGNAPGYTDSANGDFSLGSSSAMIAAARALTLGVATDSSNNQGAWENSGSGGGTTFIKLVGRGGLVG